MDTVTQGLLGAAIGHACFGHKIGRRALLYGAIGGTIPDLDVFIPRFFDLGPLAGWQHHRGITHSLFFAPVVGPILGYAAWRWSRRGRRAVDPPAYAAAGTLPAWVGLFFLALWTHPMLDFFTSYGTQLLAPFSNRRFAIDAMPIIDPGYTVPLLIAVILAALWPARQKVTRGVAVAALAFSTAYVGYAWSLNSSAEREANRQLAEHGIVGAHVRAYPTLLQPYYRRVIAQRDGEVRIGYLTMWRPAPIEWRIYPALDHQLITALQRTPEWRIFAWFAMEQTYTRVLERSDGFMVESSDLRYGTDASDSQGLWGLRARFDRNLQAVDTPRQFSTGVARVNFEFVRGLIARAFPTGGPALSGR